jgi:hypothetical protein
MKLFLAEAQGRKGMNDKTSSRRGAKAQRLLIEILLATWWLRWSCFLLIFSRRGAETQRDE